MKYQSFVGAILVLLRICNVSGIPMTNHSDNLRGAFFMSLAMAGFVLNDTFVKLVSDEVPLFQAVLIRGIMVSTMLAGVALYRGVLSVKLPRKDWNVVVFRTIGEIGATFCFLTALFHMPIANISAIMQALPLAVTLVAATFFGVKVGWRRYGAIGIGFIGVLIIIRPGTSDFNFYTLWVIGAVGFVVLRDLSTTRLSSSAPSSYVALVASAAMTLVAGAIVLTQEWQPVSGRSLAFLAMSAGFLLIGYLAAVAAMRIGEIAFVSPFRYSVMIWAIIIGLVVFGDKIEFWTYVGTAIVVGMGIYTFYREGQIARRKG